MMYDNEFKQIVEREKHVSYDGSKIIISGNTRQPNKLGLVNSAIITADQYAWLVLKKQAFGFSIDHGNSYGQKKDSKEHTWQPRPAAYIYEGKDKHHKFLSTLLKDYPGESNWDN